MFHLNLGLYYKYPFESHYSIARRFLIANDSVSWSILKQELNKQLNVKKTYDNTVVEKINQLESGKLEKAPKGSYCVKKACPECATQLYHTQLYNYNWLILCPIHGCRLESKCPKCNLPWPNINEIGHRRCVVCARTNIVERFKAKILSKPKLDFKPIYELYKIIDDRNDSFQLSNKSNGFYSGWKSFSKIDHQYFATFQLKYLHSVKNISIKKQLKKYNIQHFEVQLKRAHLLSANYTEWVDNLPMMRYELLEARAS